MTTEPLTEKQILYRDFWNAFRDYLEERGFPITLSKRLDVSCWAYLKIGKSNVKPRIELLKDTDSIRLTVEFRGRESNRERGRKWYGFFKEAKSSIESEVGFNLSWATAPRDLEPYPYFERENVDLMNREGWQMLFEWIERDMTALRNATKQRLDAFDNAS